MKFFQSNCSLHELVRAHNVLTDDCPQVFSAYPVGSEEFLHPCIPIFCAHRRRGSPIL